MSPSVSVTAYAKVNLALEVLGKRNDGFHEVRSIIQSVSLADQLSIEDAPELSVDCDLPELSGEGNLVMRAARSLLDRVGADRGVRITIRKGIPVASGLGGASADAAATLTGLEGLWNLKLQPSDLQIVAAALGSDVPFFLSGGTAIVRGRGHLVYPLPSSSRLWLVILVPPHSVEQKTAAIYRRLTPESWSTGDRVERMALALSSGSTFPHVQMGNAFDQVASETFQSLPGYREAMLNAGCPTVQLSGAGPTLFSLFEAETDARAAASRLAAHGFHPLVARTLSAPEARPIAVPRS